MLPDIYLAIDNCFASKRWTKPLRWMEVCRDIGVYYVEASADTECDPLYTTSGYLREWTDAIRDAKRETGITVFGLYSGHGTYATLGLGHDDRRIRKHILYNWLFPMIDTAAALNAGLGFFCHAFSEEVLKEALEARLHPIPSGLLTRRAEALRVTLAIILAKSFSA